MNILYLHAHDLGRFCEPYGHAIPSPNIQRLAEEGVLFRQAFCAAPSCSPSRAALVTGRWPHCNGMFGLASPSSGWTLNDYRQHIASFLGRHGFDTALAGTQHEARAPFHDPREIGYRRMFNYRPEEPTRDAKCSEICAAAQAFLAEPHDRPFFLSVGFIEPHRANQGDRRVFSKEIPAEPPDIDGRYCAPLPHLPDNPVTRRETANFKQGVAMLDRQFGAVLKALEDNNLADDTLVICTTDHGPGFPEMKCTLTDRGTGVTLIVRGPRGFRGGKVVDAMAAQMDLFPTICELLGLERPDWLQGESLMPLIRGEAEQIHEAIFTEQNYHGVPRPQRAVRTARYKYIRRFDQEARKGIDRGPAQEYWEEYGYQERPVAEEELYDLIFDPNEACNLAGDPAHAGALDDLRARLRRWREETEDPLLAGPLPEPPARRQR